MPLSINVRKMRARGYTSCVLGEVRNFSLNAIVVQETHFICKEDGQVLEKDFVVFSAFCCHHSKRVSPLVGHSLKVKVDIVFAGVAGWLIVVDIVAKSPEFRVVVVYAPNCVGRDVPSFGW